MKPAKRTSGAVTSTSDDAPEFNRKRQVFLIGNAATRRSAPRLGAWIHNVNPSQTELCNNASLLSKVSVRGGQTTGSTAAIRLGDLPRHTENAAASARSGYLALPHGTRSRPAAAQRVEHPEGRSARRSRPRAAVVRQVGSRCGAASPNRPPVASAARSGKPRSAVRDITPDEHVVLHSVFPHVLGLGTSPSGTNLERWGPWKRPLTQRLDHLAIMGSE